MKGASFQATKGQNEQEIRRSNKDFGVYQRPSQKAQSRNRHLLLRHVLKSFQKNGLTAMLGTAVSGRSIIVLCCHHPACNGQSPRHKPITVHKNSGADKEEAATQRQRAGSRISTRRPRVFENE